ncbi:hypothetical protein ACFPM0_08255 [Pseudonocardia sulfidoxydans]|uniref:hypothetical protein n=1 Tax=Pseudonocardia sulfidoxydans TaxID=54011 RepID=UPI003622FFF4
MPSIIEALPARSGPSSVACGRFRGMWTTARDTARNLTAVKRRPHDREVARGPWRATSSPADPRRDDHRVARGRGRPRPATRPESSVPCATRPPGPAFRAWPTTTHSSP